MDVKEKIKGIREYFVKNRMFSELRGFNAGVRMFDDNRKSARWILSDMKNEQRRPTKSEIDSIMYNRLEGDFIEKGYAIQAIEFILDSYPDLKPELQAALDRQKGRASSGTPSSGGSMAW
jgi:hypothetical protein